MADLPDWYTQVQGVTLEASSFRSGLDADKPASPAAGEIWLARDTGYLYVCNTAGSWDKVAKLYLELAGGTMTGAIAMGTHKITGLDAPTANADAARKLDVDTVDAKLDDVSFSQPSRAFGTIYQNGAKIRVVNAVIRGSTGTDNSEARLESVSPPTIVVATLNFKSGVANEAHTMTFFVPPNWYYSIENTLGTPVLSYVREWDLL